MKSAFLRGLSILSLGAVCGYIVLAALPLLRGRTDTVPAESAAVRDLAPVWGVFLREELVLPASDCLIRQPEASRVSAGGDLGAGLTAPAAGIYTAYLDGYEHLTAPELTVQALRSLCADRRVAQLSPGKLITSSRFLFFALLENSDAERLHIGDTCTLECAYWGGVELTLEEKGDSWQDFTPLRFSGSSGMDTVLYLREVSGSLVLGEYAGLRLPDSAFLAPGEDAVEVLTLGEACQVPVEVLYDGDGYKLVESSLLWPGSEVIIHNKHFGGK